MDRRQFIVGLLGTTAAAVVLPHLDALESIALPPKWWTSAESLTFGDVFTISGVYAVNPTTNEQTSVLQRFMVASESGVDSIADIYPKLIPEGHYRNVSNLPADDATLTPLMFGPPGIRVDATWTDN